MTDQKVIVIDKEAEIEMLPIDAAHAIKTDPHRYSMAMIDVLDASTGKTQLMPKAEALVTLGEQPDRYSIVHPAHPGLAESTKQAATKPSK